MNKKLSFKLDKENGLLIFSNIAYKDKDGNFRKVESDICAEPDPNKRLIDYIRPFLQNYK
jgi:hypothetical protein